MAVAHILTSLERMPEAERVLATMVERAPDRLSPFTVPRLMVNAVTGNISIRFGLRDFLEGHGPVHGR